MKIIDWEVTEDRYAVVFYLGDNVLRDWYGKGWNKSPYEINADRVYYEFVTGRCVLSVPRLWSVVEPCQSESAFTKDEMRNRLIPCVILLPPTCSGGSFHRAMLSPYGQRFYMGDLMEPNEEK